MLLILFGEQSLQLLDFFLQNALVVFKMLWRQMSGLYIILDFPFHEFKDDFATRSYW
jgi:hypothetical protein